MLERFLSLQSCVHTYALYIHKQNTIVDVPTLFGALLESAKGQQRPVEAPHL